MNSRYIYIYDEFLADRRYEREVAAFESKVNAYGVMGQVSRLTLFRSAKEIVEETVKRGAETVVIVGNDSTLDKTMWFLPNLDVVIGYIPLLGPSEVGGLLGIPVGAEACHTLAARSIETLDMGMLNERYFLTEVSLPATIATLQVEGKYRVSSSEGGSLQIRNLGGRVEKTIHDADAKDGLLEAVVIPALSAGSGTWWKRSTTPHQETRILFTHGEIASQDPIDARVDNHIINGFTFQVKIVPKKVRFITGRGRRLAASEEILPKTIKNDTFRPAPVSHFQMKKGL